MTPEERVEAIVGLLGSASRERVEDAVGIVVLHAAAQRDVSLPRAKETKKAARKLASDIRRVEDAAKKFHAFTDSLALTGDWSSFLPALADVRERAEKIAAAPSPAPKPDASLTRVVIREVETLLRHHPLSSDRNGKKRKQLLEVLYGGKLPVRQSRRTSSR